MISNQRAPKLFTYDLLTSKFLATALASIADLPSSNEVRGVVLTALGRRLEEGLSVEKLSSAP